MSATANRNVWASCGQSQAVELQKLGFCAEGIEVMVGLEMCIVLDILLWLLLKTTNSLRLSGLSGADRGYQLISIETLELYVTCL